MSVKNILENTGSVIAKRIRTNLAVNNINASGKLSASIEDDVTQNGNDYRLTIKALEYIFDVEEGRSPKQQRQIGYDKLLSSYTQWIKDKPISPIGQTVSELARIFVAKTRKEGTVTYRTGKKVGIISEAITPDIMEKMESDILEAMGQEFLEVVTNISNASNRTSG